MQCVKCKKDIPDNSIYCNFCGKKQQTEKRRSRRRANGQGTVYKLNGTRSKPFAVRLPAQYTDTGYCERPMLGYYETKTEALNALNNAVSNGVTDRVNATFKQVFDDWSAQSFKELSDSTITNYTTSFKHLKPLHDKKMKDLRAKDVQAIIDKLGAETGRKTNMLYSQLCKYAMSIDLISQNYAQFVKLKSKEKKEKDIFTISDIRKLQKAADSTESYADTAKIVMIMIFTGTRIGEITSIKHGETYIDYDIPYMVGGIKTEAGKDRIIPIHHAIIDYVRYFFNKNTQYLLSNTKGGQLSAHNFRERNYYPLLETLKITKKTPHSTRHTYTTMLHAAGAKDENIIKLVGHADFKTTTENYIHQSISELRDTVEMLKI